MKIAVIAGTPVDTRMGVEYLNKKTPQNETVYLPCADSPRECHLFQMSDEASKYAHMKNLFERAMREGVRHFFIYCNSLSTTFDYPALAKELGVYCVTPLDAYAALAERYGCVGVIAANDQATAGIERAFTAKNPTCYVLGTGDLRLVEDIEKGFRDEGADYLPEAIIRRRRIDSLCEFYRANGAEALVLGCTHFPYLKEALAAKTPLPIIDPADIMYDLLTLNQ